MGDAGHVVRGRAVLSGVPCARGCKRRGEHFAACESYGATGGTCRGCVPRDAAADSLVCGRCFHRTRSLLQSAPDMLGHLRALTNPMKATDYAAKATATGGGPRLHAPPPVAVELLDAADFIATLLWSAVEVVNGRTPAGRVQVPVAADAPGLVEYADAAVAEIVAGLSALSERPEMVPFVDAVIGAPASRDEWTLRTIFDRWHVADEPWWAAQPCPVCGLRAVKVRPPEVPGDETEYRCQSPSCGWVAPEDVDGFWAEAFSRREGRAA